MCFSATASFTLAAACTGVGLFSIAKCPAPGYLPLALIPLGFGAHQAIEGMVWLQIAANPGAATSGLEPALFMLFATILWPVAVPAAIRAEVGSPGRRQALNTLLVIGALIALAFLVKLFVADTSAYVDGHHLRYVQTIPALPDSQPWQLLAALSQNNLILLPYAAVAVLSMALSGLNAVRGFGALVALNLILVMVLDRPVLISVWCFFAAVGSILIALAMLEARARPHAGTATGQAGRIRSRASP